MLITKSIMNNMYAILGMKLLLGYKKIDVRYKAHYQVPVTIFQELTKIYHGTDTMLYFFMI